MSSPSEKALQILKYLPRVSLNNLVKDPYAIRKACSLFSICFHLNNNIIFYFIEIETR